MAGSSCNSGGGGCASGNGEGEKEKGDAGGGCGSGGCGSGECGSGGEGGQSGKEKPTGPAPRFCYGCTRMMADFDPSAEVCNPSPPFFILAFFCFLLSFIMFSYLFLSFIIFSYPSIVTLIARSPFVVGGPAITSTKGITTFNDQRLPYYG